MVDKKTKVIGVLIGLVILGIPSIAFSQTTTNSISDSPLFHIRTTTSSGERDSIPQVTYLGQFNHSIIIPRIIKELEQKGIKLSSLQGCTYWGAPQTVCFCKNVHK